MSRIRSPRHCAEICQQLTATPPKGHVRSVLSVGKSPVSLGRHKAKATPGRRMDKHGSSKAAIRQTEGTAGANARTDYTGKMLPCTYIQIQCEEPMHKDYGIQSAVCQVTAFLKHKSFSFLYSSPPSLHLPLQLLVWAPSSDPYKHVTCVSLPAEVQHASILCAPFSSAPLLPKYRKQ